MNALVLLELETCDKFIVDQRQYMLTGDRKDMKNFIIFWQGPAPVTCCQRRILSTLMGVFDFCFAYWQNSNSRGRIQDVLTDSIRQVHYQSRKYSNKAIKQTSMQIYKWHRKYCRRICLLTWSKNAQSLEISPLRFLSNPSQRCFWGLIIPWRLWWPFGEYLEMIILF